MALPASLPREGVLNQARRRGFISFRNTSSPRAVLQSFLSLV
jgi:hypothetical protein